MRLSSPYDWLKFFPEIIYGAFAPKPECIVDTLECTLTKF